MTVCNVSVRDHSVFLATDTLVANYSAAPGDPPSHVGKLFTFSHIPACGIGRGHSIAAASFAAVLSVAGGSFDEMVRVAPGVLGVTFQQIRPQLGQIGDLDPAKQAFLLACYSEHAKRMAAVMLRQETVEEGFKAWEIDDREPSLEPY